jgi:hypothetical protein
VVTPRVAYTSLRLLYDNKDRLTIAPNLFQTAAGERGLAFSHSAKDLPRLLRAKSLDTRVTTTDAV